MDLKNSDSLPLVYLYSDGSCLGNPGPGGWAYLLKRPQAPDQEDSGSEAQTTSNRMELMAAIKGLQSLKIKSRVRLVSDSQYVVKGITEWMSAWKKRGWKKADNHPVMNMDLWQILDQSLMEHEVEAQWVKGHAGHPENERVDHLANTAAEQWGRLS